MITRTTRSRVLIFAIAALALGLYAGAAVAEEGNETQVHKIKIHQRAQCEGDDCEDGGHRAIFIDDDGNTQLLEGEDLEWIGEDGENHFVKMMHGAHKGGFLGVGLTELTPELRAHFGVPEDAGVMVSKIVDDSPAQRAGIRVGDIITLVDGEAVGSGAGLAGEIGGHADGESVIVEVWRDGVAQQISATLDEREVGALAGMPRIHGLLGGDHGAMMHPMHRMHGEGGGPMTEKRIVVQCDDDTEDCTVEMGEGDLEFDCGGAEEFEVQVECRDEGCTCTVNGEETDCSEIPGVPSQ